MMAVKSGGNGFKLHSNKMDCDQAIGSMIGLTS